MVWSSVSINGYGEFRFSEISDYLIAQIKSINKRQRRKWLKSDIVSPQSLQYFWDEGIRFQIERPSCGMKVLRFTGKILDFYKYSDADPAMKDWVLYVYENIITEMKPSIRKYKIRPNKTRFHAV